MRAGELTRSADPTQYPLQIYLDNSLYIITSLADGIGRPSLVEARWEVDGELSHVQHVVKRQAYEPVDEISYALYAY